MSDSHHKKPLWKKLFLFGIKIAVSVFCFVHLAENFGHEFTSLSYSFDKINWFFLSLAVLLFALSQIVSVWRWQVCCEPLSILEPAQKATKFGLPLAKIYFVGLFCNNFLPGSFGGDLIRAYMLRKSLPSAKWTDCAGSVFIDRVFGLIALSWIGFTASYFVNRFGHPLPASLISGLGLMSVASIVGILSTSIFGRLLPPPTEDSPEEEDEKGFFEKAKIKLAEFIDAMRKIKRCPIAFAKLILSSVLIQVLVTLCLICLSQALKIEIKPAYIWLINPIVTLGSLIAPSMNGLGVREGIYAYLFKALGYSGANGIILSLGWLFVILLVSLPGAAFMLFKKKMVELPIKELQANKSFYEESSLSKSRK